MTDQPTEEHDTLVEALRESLPEEIKEALEDHGRRATTEEVFESFKSDC